MADLTIPYELSYAAPNCSSLRAPALDNTLEQTHSSGLGFELERPSAPLTTTRPCPCATRCRLRRSFLLSLPRDGAQRHQNGLGWSAQFALL